MIFLLQWGTSDNIFITVKDKFYQLLFSCINLYHVVTYKLFKKLHSSVKPPLFKILFLFLFFWGGGVLGKYATENQRGVLP
jgi:hypothetical protein